MDFKSLAEVDRLTLPEYNLLMEAVRLKNIDKDYRQHVQAWLGFVVKARKKSGKNYKPVYSKFKQFYDYKAAQEKQVDKGKSKFSGIGKVLNKGV